MVGTNWQERPGQRQSAARLCNRKVERERSPPGRPRLQSRPLFSHNFSLVGGDLSEAGGGRGGSESPERGSRGRAWSQMRGSGLRVARGGSEAAPSSIRPQFARAAGREHRPRGSEARPHVTKLPQKFRHEKFSCWKITFLSAHRPSHTNFGGKVIEFVTQFKFLQSWELIPSLKTKLREGAKVTFLKYLLNL